MKPIQDETPAQTLQEELIDALDNLVTAAKFCDAEYCKMMRYPVTSDEEWDLAVGNAEDVLFRALSSPCPRCQKAMHVADTHRDDESGEEFCTDCDFERQLENARQWGTVYAVNLIKKQQADHKNRNIWGEIKK